MKPTLKKVSKYENKFAKLQKKAAEFNFRNQLKQVKKKEFTLEEEDKEVRIIVFDSILAAGRGIDFFSCFWAKLFFSARSLSPVLVLRNRRDKNIFFAEVIEILFFFYIFQHILSILGIFSTRQNCFGRYYFANLIRLR